MKIVFALLLLTILTFWSSGQSPLNPPDSAERKKKSVSPEVEEALRNFDFSRIRINPNNLRIEDIERLEKNFLPAVKPYLIKDGDLVERLRRIAKPVFELHKAEKSKIVVFEDKIPIVFTWKESFVVFSSAAMDILDDKEIAALVAHEMGHLYFAEAFARAIAENDDHQMRVIELKCDLVALETLSLLKMKRSKLISAVKKLIEKRTEMKAESFQFGSPPFADREAVPKLYRKKNQ